MPFDKPTTALARAHTQNDFRSPEGAARAGFGQTDPAGRRLELTTSVGAL